MQLSSNSCYEDQEILLNSLKMEGLRPASEAVPEAKAETEEELICDAVESDTKESEDACLQVRLHSR